MSLTTRCPACGTLFRVVPDQLRISEGWVRCGRCAAVFDAHAHMPGSGAFDPPALPVQPPIPARSAPTDLPAPVPPVAPLVGEGAVADPPDVASAVVTPLPPVVTAMSVDMQVLPEAAEYALPAVVAPALALEALLHDELAVDAEKARASHDAVAYASDDSLQDSDENPAFVRDAARKAFWRSPLIRLPLLGGCGGLLLLLGLQMLLQERDRLAAVLPPLEPLLQAVCGVARCEIRPLRQIDAVAVDSSAFGKLQSDTFRLHFVLKNGATHAVATPAIELTLTDTQEHVVARKVFFPAEFGALQPALASGAEMSGEVVFTIGLGVDAASVVGYRLLAFYP